MRGWWLLGGRGRGEGYGGWHGPLCFSTKQKYLIDVDEVIADKAGTLEKGSGHRALLLTAHCHGPTIFGMKVGLPHVETPGNRARCVGVRCSGGAVPCSVHRVFYLSFDHKHCALLRHRPCRLLPFVKRYATG